MNPASDGTTNFTMDFTEAERPSESHPVKSKQRNPSKGADASSSQPAYLDSKRKRLNSAEDCLHMLKLTRSTSDGDKKEDDGSSRDSYSDHDLPSSGAESDSDDSDSSDECDKSDSDSPPSLASDSDTSSGSDGVTDLDCIFSDTSSDDSDMISYDREELERNRRGFSGGAAAGLAAFFPLVRPMFEVNQGFLLSVIQQFLMHHPEMSAGNSPPGALPAVIESLPKVKITQTEVDSNLVCCICRCDFEVDEEVLQLPCAHKYHAPCVETWLKMHATCPTCRDVLPH